MNNLEEEIIRLKAQLAQAKTREQEVCICAAVRFSDGRIARGHRHDSCYNTSMGWTPAPQFDAGVQGFITSRNRFVTREEGARLQNEAGIISTHTGKPIVEMLFSEDLYLQENDPVALRFPADPPKE